MSNTLTSTLKKKKKGFTLIELIIVIAIIAIIAAIAIPNYSKIRNESKVKADTQSVLNVQRITETLVTNGTIGDNDVITVSLATTPISVIDTTKSNADLSEYYRNVQKPQAENKTYSITVTNGVASASLIDVPAATK